MRHRLKPIHWGTVVVVIFVAFVVFIGFGPNAAGTGNGQYRNISPQDGKSLIDSGEELILLDVRTPAENFASRIPNSVLIPVDVIEQEAASQLPDRDVIILVYCRSGRRSVTASLALVKKMGYTNVYNLGGIIDWPYEKEAG